ncbi:MAG: lactate utilization protein B [Terriglobales bacterium]
MSSVAEQTFHRLAGEKAADLAHRNTIHRAIDTYDAAVAAGRARFADWETARQRCHDIKQEAISHLDRYLEEFEANVERRGGKVFWASDAEQACTYVAGLASARGVKQVVKSKSMITEEIHLNAVLQKQGVDVLETDLGEYIVQLRGEPPYHILTPAMHLNRAQIADLFRERLPQEFSAPRPGNKDGLTQIQTAQVSSNPPEAEVYPGESHGELVAVARRALRREFFSADMGISGANFLVADAGMVAISTNEGNGRLCTTLPRIHVVLASIEKVIPHLQDLAILWPVLTTAGTGQRITTYSTLIGGPRTPQEIDGPEEFHVVLLDNGRSRLLADSEQREVLHCIRCGACLNACPVFRNIGGHAYGTVYSGPIGSVLTQHLNGPGGFQHLSSASTLCGNCNTVCPVKIDLAHHLLHNRRNSVNAGDRPWQERLAMRCWRWAMLSEGRYRLAGRLARTMLRTFGDLGLSILRPWTACRQLPTAPKLSFRQMWRNDGSR